MKIISGKLKGRNIEGYDLKGTRPTMDRVKESLFATIQNHVEGSIVLDLFSGSGNLAFEAISNGSKQAYLNDISRKAVDTINKNIEKFNIKEYTKVLNLDYKKALNYFIENNITFDIIFLDPPYNLDVIEEILLLIDKNNLLNKNGVIICEYSKPYVGLEYINFKLDKTKKYGDKYISIYYENK